MKFRYLILYLALCLTILFAENNILTKYEKLYLTKKVVLKVCTNPNWKPIEFNDNNTPNGISIDTLKIIQNNIHINLEFIKTKSWSESQLFLKQKKCDILPSAIETIKRLEYANFTKPYLKYSLAIITKDDKPLVHKLEDILDKSMSRKKGSGLISKLKRKYPQINIIETKGYQEAFESVADGDVYFTIATLPVLSYYKNKFDLKNLQIAGYTDMKYNLSIAVNKDDLVLLNILNKSLNKINKNTHNVIYEKWTRKDVEFKTDYKLISQIIIGVILFSLIMFYFQFRSNRFNIELKKTKKELEDLNNTLEDRILLATQDLKEAQKIAKLGSWKFDSKINNLEWSDEVYDIFNVDKLKDKITKIEDFIKYIHPEDLERVSTAYDEHIHLQKSYFVIHKIITGDNQVRFVEERCETVFDENSNPLISNGTIQDITEQQLIQLSLKEKDKQLLEQSRLAQMGEMISMIAHQWRQPLSAISSTSSALSIKIQLKNLDDKTAMKLLQNISDYSQHLSSTIDDFRNFFKPNKAKIYTTYNELISSVLSIIDVSIKNKNIELIKDFNSTDSFYVYNNEIKQVILNLIKNAEDILLEKNIENPRITIKTDKNLLLISDNGGGVPKEIITKIFDPYFSTKTKKDGTGLGLYMSKTIIEEHCGGELTVFNDENGAVFKINLHYKEIS